MANNAIEREVSNEGSHTRDRALVQLANTSARDRPGKECLPAAWCRPLGTRGFGAAGPPRTAAQGPWRAGAVPHRHRSLHRRILLATAVREARSHREDHGPAIRE